MQNTNASPRSRATEPLISFAAASRSIASSVRRDRTSGCRPPWRISDELDRELHVGERADAELEVELRRLGRLHALALDALAHVPDVGHPIDRDAVGRERGVGRVQLEPAAEVGVAGDRACPQQRLELPRLGVSLPVLEVAGDRARERTVAALGTQIGVGLPARIADAAQHLLGELAGPLLGVGALALVHEHQVEIARDVELTGAELAHADHRERKVVVPARLRASASASRTTRTATAAERLAGLAGIELAAGRAGDRVDEIAGGIGLGAEQRVAQAADA